VLGLDQVQTSLRAGGGHAAGMVLAAGQRALTQHFPAPGRVEHAAEEICAGTGEAAREALAAAGERPSAIGITNQRETVVVWERATLRPVGRALVWQDRRTAARCRELAGQGLEPLLRERTGLVADPYFSATKLEWMLRDPALRRRADQAPLIHGRQTVRRAFGRHGVGRQNLTPADRPGGDQRPARDGQIAHLGGGRRLFRPPQGDLDVADAADHGGQFLIRRRVHCAPLIGGRFDPCGDRIGLGDRGIAGDVKLGLVVSLHYGEEEARHGVLAEVAGDITDAELAVGVAIVVVWGNRST
jgi:hypothetical protein